MDISKEMEQLLAASLKNQEPERPELLWLQEQFRRFMAMEGLDSKKEADRRLYQRMYGKAPRKDSEFLKIRYWRTGRHVPSSYEECLTFGQALCLEEEQLRFLMQGYYDGCDRIFWKEPGKSQEVYWKRRTQLDQLVEGYLCRVSHKRMKQMKIPREQLCHSIRHLYYTDALHYVSREYTRRKYTLERHITSINYDSELSRNLKLLGVIPRKTMIRHLFILGMPNLSLEFINEMLRNLGYLPLQPEHTLRTGERLDLLLIQLLLWYEAVRRERGVKEGNQWMQRGLRTLDELLEQKGLKHQRFMFFKALE